jgi:zinc transporter ZupT
MMEPEAEPEHEPVVVVEQKKSKVLLIALLITMGIVVLGAIIGAVAYTLTKDDRIILRMPSLNGT